jgi:hypothetical protein
LRADKRKADGEIVYPTRFAKSCKLERGMSLDIWKALDGD